MWSDYFRVWLNVSKKINTSWTFSTWFNSLGKVTCKMYCSFFFSFINKNVLKDIEAPTGWVNDSRRACSRPWSLDISFGVLFVPILDEVTFRILSWWQGTNLGAIATSWAATHPNFIPAFNPKNWGEWTRHTYSSRKAKTADLPPLLVSSLTVDPILLSINPRLWWLQRELLGVFL